MSLFSFGKKQNNAQAASYAAQRRNILNPSVSFYVRESFKTLRTNIRFFQAGEGCKKFCLTSSVSGEGKSITVLNLAITFAESGQKVLLIDADLRRPSQARLLIEQATPGLSNVLAGHCDENEAIRSSVYPNLDVLLSGDLPPNPSELLDSDRMKQLIKRLSVKYDYILVDTAPVGVVTDACVVARHLDGMVFLVRQNQTEREVLARSLQQIKNAGVQLMGFIINGYISESGKQYKYNYYRRSKYNYESNNRTIKDKK